MVLFERSAFPLTRFFISIGEITFKLSPGEVKNVELIEGEHEITVSSYWVKTQKHLSINNDTVIMIKHAIPDLFYIAGLGIITLLAVLTYFHLIPSIILVVFNLIFFIPISYFTFINTKGYFRISNIE